eukprot:scaffold983_cov102-Skeletonema_menzelii.AAC.1
MMVYIVAADSRVVDSGPTSTLMPHSVLEWKHELLLLGLLDMTYVDRCQAKEEKESETQKLELDKVNQSVN